MTEKLSECLQSLTITGWLPGENQDLAFVSLLASNQATQSFQVDYVSNILADLEYKDNQSCSSSFESEYSILGPLNQETLQGMHYELKVGIPMLTFTGTEDQGYVAIGIHDAFANSLRDDLGHYHLNDLTLLPGYCGSKTCYLILMHFKNHRETIAVIIEAILRSCETWLATAAGSAEKSHSSLPLSSHSYLHILRLCKAGLSIAVERAQVWNLLLREYIANSLACNPAEMAYILKEIQSIYGEADTEHFMEFAKHYLTSVALSHASQAKISPTLHLPRRHESRILK